METAIERVHLQQVRAEKLLTSLVGGLSTSGTSCSPPFAVSKEDGSLTCSFQYPVQKLQVQDPNLVQQAPHKADNMTRRIQTTANAQVAKRPMHVYATKPASACEPWCSCACHVKRVLRMKQPATIGSFSISYSGLPWVTASCDQKACRSKSVASVAVNVQFPDWFWNRYLSSSFSYAPIRGPELNIRLPRTVSWVSGLWRHGLDGNLRAVQDLFSRGLASPWDVQALGGSLLHYATDHAHWDLCKFLVEQGAILDNEDDFHNSPTSLAWEKVLSGSLSINEESLVATLFTNTDYLRTRQFTLLHKIVLRIVPRDIESELDFSTRDLNAVDSSGRTCLSWAAARGDNDAMETLLRYDADVHLRDGQGNAPLHYARNARCVDILLAGGADINTRNSFGHTPLHMVCRGTASLPLLKKLLQAGADIDAIDHSGETALSNATYGKHVECALYLIEQGADLDIANGPNGAIDAPIHIALASDVPEVLQLLLTRGANYTRPNSHNRTILHYAAGMVSEETVKIMTLHGLKDIDLAIKDFDGKTAKDLVEEREDDDDTNFKARLYSLLDSVAAAKDLDVRVEAAPNMSSLTTQWNKAMDTLKDGPITQVTPVTPEIETGENLEIGVYYDEYDTQHGPVVFYDAVEEATDVAGLVEIAA